MLSLLEKSSRFLLGICILETNLLDCSKFIVLSVENNAVKSFVKRWRITERVPLT